MIEVLLEATNRSLTTKYRVREELRDIAEEAHLAEFIARASGMIEEYLARTLAVQTYREKVAGYGSDIALLSVLPVIEVESVTSGGDPITDYEIHDSEAGMIYRQGGWTWDGARWWKNSPFPDTYSRSFNFYFTYRAGYVLPGDETETVSRTLPREIEQCCLDLIRHLYLHRLEDATIISQKTATYSVTYADGGSAAILRRLDRWRITT